MSLIGRIQSLEYKWLVAIAFIAGLFMDLLDTTIVNVALPTIGERFNAGNTTLEWIVTGYLLSLAVWIPASGWLGDRFGTKKVFLFALAMFTAGSVLCGIAWNIETLIFFRVIQGIGGGMLTPVGTAMLFRAFPPEERAQASAVLTVPVALAPALGPVLGGLLVDYLSWRWIFFVNIPIGIAGFLFALAFLKEHTEEQVGRFDLWGLVLSGAGLPLALYALSRAPHEGWTSTEVLITGLGGLAILALLVVVELRTAAPMLNLRLLGDRMFRSANAVYFLIMSGLLGLLFLLPLYLQQLRGLSALESGLTTFPQAVGVIVSARFVSRLYPRIGPRRLLAAGMAITTVTTLAFTDVDLGTDLWWIRALMFVRGVGFGFAIIPIQAATFSTISPAMSGRASALFNTNRQVASSIGVAILATVLTDRTNSHVADQLSRATTATQAAAAQHGAMLGFQDAYLAAGIIAAIGFLCAFLIRDKDAAASMVQAPGAASRPQTAGGIEAEPVMAD